MTALLENAIERIRGLPGQRQDDIARLINDAIDDDDFDRLIESHPEALDRLVAQAREDIAMGHVSDHLPGDR